MRLCPTDVMVWFQTMLLKCVLLVLQILLNDIIQTEGLSEVTCGSVVKMLNTEFQVRLQSHDVKYASGSGQQSVTGINLKEDFKNLNSSWRVKGTAMEPCTKGKPIACSQTIRLEHVQTRRNLHTHEWASPFSGHQEVSAFGEEGEGDSGDNWEVLCDGRYWMYDDSVQLWHADTNAFLAATGSLYGPPIIGQMEIVGSHISDYTCDWTATEGILAPPTGTQSTRSVDERNEL